MSRYFAVPTIVLMLGMVVTRALLMQKQGIEAMNFGKIDKTDFLIPPFALFYFYIVFAATFNFPTVSTQAFFHAGAIFLGRSVFLSDGAAAVSVEPDFFWAEFSCWHRHRPS